MTCGLSHILAAPRVRMRCQRGIEICGTVIFLIVALSPAAPERFRATGRQATRCPLSDKVCYRLCLVPATIARFCSLQRPSNKHLVLDRERDSVAPPLHYPNQSMYRLQGIGIAEEVNHRRHRRATPKSLR